MEISRSYSFTKPAAMVAMPNAAASSVASVDLLFSPFLGPRSGHNSAVRTFSYVVFPEQCPLWCHS